MSFYIAHKKTGVLIDNQPHSTVKEAWEHAESFTKITGDPTKVVEITDVPEPPKPINPGGFVILYWSESPEMASDDEARGIFLGKDHEFLTPFDNKDDALTRARGLSYEYTYRVIEIRRDQE